MNLKSKKPTYVFALKKNGKVYRYMARIIVNYRKIYLGCFKTQGEAVNAVKNYFDNQPNHGKK